jgi:CHAT domain-containing protein
LSACETGLGEVAGGEGVFGLQRAFHLARGRNVVASPWQVDDEATAALMALFYHHLWVEKRTPLEALRQAQLSLYRHLERIAALARERGPNFAKAARLPAVCPPCPVQAGGP